MTPVAATIPLRPIVDIRPFVADPLARFKAGFILPEMNDETPAALDLSFAPPPPTLEGVSDSSASAAAAGEPAPSHVVRFLAIAKEIAIILLLFLGLRNFVVQARFIPSASMHPTLIENDRLLVEILSKHLFAIRRGEILVFYVPNEHKPDFWETILSSFGRHDDGALIKRVIGLPGETIEVIPNDGVYINGQRLDEPYVQALPNDHFERFTVPAGNYFMMGDNRNLSRDSRRWGTLPHENIIGRALVRFYPFTRVGVLLP